MPRNKLQSKLSDLLGVGWQVVGFTHTLEAATVYESAASQSDGYTILLRKDAEMAVAVLSYDEGDIVISSVSIITGEAGD
jgi:hypothetical protein